MTDSADDSGTGGSLEVSVKQEVMEEYHQQVEREIENDDDDDDDDEDALKMDTSEPVEDVQAQDQKMEKDADDKGMKKEEEENKEENKSVALDERREGVKEAVKDAESEPQEAAPNAKTPPPPPPPTTPTPPASVVEPVVVIKTEPGLVSLASAESNTIRPWSNGVIFSHRRAITPSGGAAVSAELVPITNGTTSSSSSSRKTASPSSSPSLQSTAPAPPTNRVPSVILGQSGGVKTMVWTGHWADQQNKSNNSSSSSSSLSVSALNAKPAPIHHNSDAASIRLSVDGLLSLASASALAQQNELRRHSSASSIGRQSSSSPSQVHL